MASRQFSIPTVLRMVPNELLGQVFERLGHGGLGIDWKELKEREIEPVLRTINALPRCQRMAIETTLRSLFELGCETGIQAIIEAAIRCGEPDLTQSMPRQVGPYAKAAWSWLHRREAFDKAVIIHQVDHLTWWRKRRDLPRVQPDTSPSAAPIDWLARSLAFYCGLKVEAKPARWSILLADESITSLLHPDDFVQSVTIRAMSRTTDSANTAANVRDGVRVLSRGWNAQLFAHEVPVNSSRKSKSCSARRFSRADLPTRLPHAAYELRSTQGSVSISRPIQRIKCESTCAMRLDFIKRVMNLAQVPDS
ncbi:MAG: hypothetical protein R3B96_01455 [Pirellulaceae bacterium]